MQIQKIIYWNRYKILNVKNKDENHSHPVGIEWYKKLPQCETLFPYRRGTIRQIKVNRKFQNDNAYKILELSS